LKICCRIIVAQ